jgi:molybdate transport system ATP-binding protein
VLEADVEVDRREFAVRAQLSVAPGERLALFGPSGAGKTTLLEVIAGLVPARRARIALGGRVLTSTARPAVAIPPWRRRVGLLRQDPGLFPHLTVAGNLRYGLGAGPPRPGAPGLAELAGLLGIAGVLEAMPARLSGGQAHRVALGRLLLAPCDALLLDEPYAGLDASLRRALTGLVRDLVTDREVPSVLVAHELAEAQAFADRLVVLDRGTVLQSGAPGEVVRKPASRRVAGLVGYLGFVPAAGPAAGSAGDSRVAGIHPDRVVPGAEPGRGLVLAGTLTAVRPSGAGWEADLLTAGVPVTCHLAEPPGEAGGLVTLTALDPPWFGPDGAAVAGPARSGQAGA